MDTTRYLLGCAMLGLTLVAQAQIVECLDANGKKIYSQSCPVGSEKQRDIATPPPPKPAVSNEATKRALDEQEKAFAKRREERLQSEEKNNEAQKKETDDAQQCANAKRRLGLLESGRQFKRADPSTGEHVPMDEAQRQAEIDNLHAQIDASCR